jgi:CopG-like RHH_1 or ribbon-helix-helix domain, RHH_5
MAGRRKSRTPRDAVVAVYLPAKLLDKLRDVADRERRTASTQALIYIERALDQERG